MQMIQENFEILITADDKVYFFCIYLFIFERCLKKFVSQYSWQLY